jgi:hypothetical protein
MKKWLWEKIVWPWKRRALRNGVIAYLELNAAMKRARWPRQRRRHALRDLQRDPRAWVRVLELLYAGRKG